MDKDHILHPLTLVELTSKKHQQLSLVVYVTVFIHQSGLKYSIVQNTLLAHIPQHTLSPLSFVDEDHQFLLATFSFAREYCVHEVYLLLLATSCLKYHTTGKNGCRQGLSLEMNIVGPLHENKSVGKQWRGRGYPKTVWNRWSLSRTHMGEGRQRALKHTRALSTSRHLGARGRKALKVTVCPIYGTTLTFRQAWHWRYEGCMKTHAVG